MSQKTEKTELEKKLEAEEMQEEAVEAEAVVEESAEESADESAKLAEECADLKDQLLRSRAEFDNYRKRMAREMERIRRTAAENLIRDLLPVLDNIERALGHAEESGDGFAQGVKLVYSQFYEVLRASGVDSIPALGENFDPNVHEALSHMPSDEYAADTVMEEFQRGYRIGDYVLRPAKVVVSSGPADSGEEAGVAEGSEAESETTSDSGA